MFLAVGAMKATQPIAVLVDTLGWPAAVPAALVRVIGVAELLGGLGLILPAATRVKPMLTPLAGVGLAMVMLLATIFHISRGELGALPLPLVLGASRRSSRGARGEGAHRTAVITPGKRRHGRRRTGALAPREARS